MGTIKIGGGQGFWGDSPDAAIYMVKHSDIDYLACDYLAELTLSIMARQKLKNPNAGFASDFIKLMKVIAPEAKEKGIKILTNAGGMNIEGCIDNLTKLAQEKEIHNYNLGYVTGDDLTGKIDDLLAAGVDFANMDDVGDFSEIKDKIVNANVYFGREPTLECLKGDADVVITGRSTDSALFLAPLQKSLGWADDDLDNLARGIMAGHLLECGGQGSGGNFDYDWRSVENMDELGFPIAEMSDDDFVITKASGSGGLISEQTCKEQMLYEVHDPANYVTPDVTVDISNVTVKQIGENRVSIREIKGKEKPDKLKLSIGYFAGYKVATMLSFAWPDAYEKAQYAAEIIMKKMAKRGIRPEDINISYIGLNSLHLGVADMSPEKVKDVNEVVLRIAIRTNTKEEASWIIPEIAPLQLNGPPGASFFGGRAHVQEVIGLWPTLIPRDCVELVPHIVTVK